MDFQENDSCLKEISLKSLQNVSLCAHLTREKSGFEPFPVVKRIACQKNSVRHETNSLQIDFLNSAKFLKNSFFLEPGENKKSLSEAFPAIFQL